MKMLSKWLGLFIIVPWFPSCVVAPEELPHTLPSTLDEPEAAPVEEVEEAAEPPQPTDEGTLTPLVPAPAPDAVLVIGPAPGARLDGVVPLAATILGADGDVVLHFRVDGEDVASSSGPPWTADWDSTDVSEGEHRVEALVPGSGKGGLSGPVPIVVDRTPPSVAVIEPTPSKIYEDRVRIAIEAQDAGGVGSVLLQIDGGHTVLLKQPPWEAWWDTAGLGHGDVGWSAVVTDLAGHETAAWGVARIF